MDNLFPCPICGTRCLTEEIGSFNICPVCGWEDDRVMRKYPDETYGGKWSFNSAREAWAEGKTLFPRYPNPNAKKD